VMPDARANALIAEERAALLAVLDAEAPDVVNDFRARCTDWLVENFDDARLLYTGFDAAGHAGPLPLLFTLARLLAPAGALLELRVLCEPRKGRHPWEESLCYDRKHGIVYTLNEPYFSARCPSAAYMLCSAPVTVRRWAKDGGIPRLMYSWLRYRKELPLEVVQVVQELLDFGTDQMDVPELLCPQGW